MRTRRTSVVAVAAVAALVVPWLVGSPVLAQPQVTTPYPAVDVAAGDQVDVDLAVASDTTERVDLEVTSAPEGWQTSLQAGGFTVRAVTATPDAPAEPTLTVSVPADAPEGTNEIVVTASSDSGSQALPIQMRVTEAATSAVSLETEFETLRGGADDTFSYSVTLSNDVPEETTFSLAARGPENWEVTASPSSQSQANTVTVGAGGTATINVEATPPPDIEAGTYPVTVEASGGGQQAQLELGAEVVGTVELEFTTANERLNAAGTAGDGTQVRMNVTNSGSAPVTGLQLSATPPTDWDVQFEPATVESVPPGETVPVTATITPTEDAVVGDYVVTTTASSDQREAQVELRYTVESSTGWSIAAVLVVLLVIGILWAVFHRVGRR